MRHRSTLGLVVAGGNSFQLNELKEQRKVDGCSIVGRKCGVVA